MGKSLEKFANPEYLDMMSDYRMIRDCSKGSRAIKEAGVLYLPMLKAQNPQDYENYKTRALFFPITGKSASTLVGMVTAKAPTVTHPDIMSDYFTDTGSSYQFSEFYISTFMEIVLMGRYGILIDGPTVQSVLPRPTPYIAENIVRWVPNEVTGELEDLMLRECVKVSDGSPFGIDTVTRYRRCFLVNGVYTVHVLDEDLEIVSGYVPLFSGLPLDHVPFVCIGSTGVHLNPDRPPMLDIATINHSHYLTSADLEWGRHMIGLPTPVISGADESTVLHVGGTKAWILPNAEAKAYFLEFEGQGLQSLEKALSEKISLMATMSARMIDQSTRGSESAETVKLRYMSETAGLIHIIKSVEAGLTMVYSMIARMLRAADSVVVKFPTQILNIGIEFGDLKILFEAYFNGSIDKNILLYNLRRLNAVDPDATDAQVLQWLKDPIPNPVATVPQPNAT